MRFSQTENTGLSTSRSIRVPVFGLVLAVIVGGTLVANPPDGEERTQVPRRVLDELSDRDPLGTLAALPDSIAVLEATVVELGGPKVSVDASGFVAYDSDSEGFPFVVAEPTNGDLTILPRGRKDTYERVQALEQLADKGQVTLMHSEGLYSVGETYAFFVGIWGESDFSVLYAHSTDRNTAAIGFERGSVVQRESLRRLASEESQLSQIVSLAQELYGERYEGASRGDLTKAVLGEEAAKEPEPLGDGQLPVEPDEIDERLGKTQSLEVILIRDIREYEEFALVNADGKTLGWFGSNDLGYVILSGFVSADGDLFEVVSRAGERDSPSVVELPRSAKGSYSLRIPKSPSDEVGVVIDLRRKSDRGVEVFTDSDRYMERLEELEHVLSDGKVADATVENP